MNLFIEQMEGMGEVERLRFIQAHAEDTIEGYSHLYQFTDAEINDMREDYVDTSIRLSDIQKELDDVKADFKQRMTPHKQVATDLLKKLTDKAERRKEDVYIIHDHEAKRIYYVNAAGNVVWQRPFITEDVQRQQGSLMSVKVG